MLKKFGEKFFVPKIFLGRKIFNPKRNLVKKLVKRKMFDKKKLGGKADKKKSVKKFW